MRSPSRAGLKIQVCVLRWHANRSDGPKPSRTQSQNCPLARSSSSPPPYDPSGHSALAPGLASNTGHIRHCIASPLPESSDPWLMCPLAGKSASSACSPVPAVQARDWGPLEWWMVLGPLLRLALAALPWTWLLAVLSWAASVFLQSAGPSPAPLPTSPIGSLVGVPSSSGAFRTLALPHSASSAARCRPK